MARIPDPLIGLNDIDWSTLEHAYGAATDTPRHLTRFWRATTSRTRRDALRALAHSVYHQSGGYSASPAAMPFLLRLLAHPRTRLKIDLLRLIIDLGVPGNVYTLASHGYVDPTAWLERWHGPDIGHCLRCRTHYEGATTTLMNHLRGRGARLRAWAAYALAWLPTHADAIIAALQDQYDRERHPHTRVAILLAIGVLSRSQGTAQRNAHLRWQRARFRRARHTSLRMAHAIAALYLRRAPPTPEALNTLAHIMTAPPKSDLYPHPWLDGDLSTLCQEVLRTRAAEHAWALDDLWLETYRRWAALPARDDNDVGRRLLRSALLASPNDPVRQRAVLTEIALRPSLMTVAGEFQQFLRTHHLPSHLDDIVTHLGWLPPRNHLPPPLCEQWPERDALHHLPQTLQQATFDLRIMLLRFHPITPALLRNIAPHMPQHMSQHMSQHCPGHRDAWSLLGQNSNLLLDDETLLAFANRWSLWDLINNPSIPWTPARVDAWPGTFHWRALSHRADFPWTERYLADHVDVLDWDALSSNPGLPWSDALIDRYADDWSWHRLSQNPALPWSDALLQRYRRWYWNVLSGNDGLPWSKEFLYRHWDRLDACQLCNNAALPWSEDFLHRHRDDLACWGNLSANPGLPWSADLIARYHDRWNWDSLSTNPHLPWSAALVFRFSKRWSWQRLLANPSLPWNDDLIEALATRVHAISTLNARYDLHQIPWRVDWLNDARLAPLLIADDPQLYQRILAPLLNNELVSEIFQSAATRSTQVARSRWRHLITHRPDLTLDHPLPRALGLTHALTGASSP